MIEGEPGCPHGRHHWSMCPWCNGINVINDSTGAAEGVLEISTTTAEVVWVVLVERDETGPPLEAYPKDPDDDLDLEFEPDWNTRLNPWADPGEPVAAGHAKRKIPWCTPIRRRRCRVTDRPP